MTPLLFCFALAATSFHHGHCCHKTGHNRQITSHSRRYFCLFAIDRIVFGMSALRLSENSTLSREQRNVVFACAMRALETIAVIDRLIVSARTQGPRIAWHSEDLNQKDHEHN
jgi:hypothetical protein